MPVAIVFLALFLMSIYLWALINADTARTLVAELKRRWRLYLTQSGGVLAAQMVACRLVRSAAKKHIDPHAVHEVLAARRTEMIERLGRRYADEILGKPTPLENNF